MDIVKKYTDIIQINDLQNSILENEYIFELQNLDESVKTEIEKNLIHKLCSETKESKIQVLYTLKYNYYKNDVYKITQKTLAYVNSLIDNNLKSEQSFAYLIINLYNYVRKFLSINDVETRNDLEKIYLVTINLMKTMKLSDFTFEKDTYKTDGAPKNNIQMEIEYVSQFFSILSKYIPPKYTESLIKTFTDRIFNDNHFFESVNKYFLCCDIYLAYFNARLLARTTHYIRLCSMFSEELLKKIRTDDIDIYYLIANYEKYNDNLKFYIKEYIIKIMRENTNNPSFISYYNQCLIYSIDTGLEYDVEVYINNLTFLELKNLLEIEHLNANLQYSIERILYDYSNEDMINPHTINYRYFIEIYDTMDNLNKQHFVKGILNKFSSLERKGDLKSLLLLYSKTLLFKMGLYYNVIPFIESLDPVIVERTINSIRFEIDHNLLIDIESDLK
jgi:hypothetical protein